ncbi:hypothetical protein [Bacillus alkalicellulosilyticus]|uniref:hypothetical protein n=1 Tax=Alkalihalobacterium alkalicellulosilyticum TaxID=1912214 RepID=UPI00099723B7|nr:hypothetical protein [Bacillus alkalicellulosilyticus]
MIKFLIYLLVLFVLSYFYALVTKGTVFTNFYVMLFSFLALVFFFEWVVHRYKKTRTHDANKEEL